ncbi:RagB/SusD family nutrient uptake outer membrane protein [Chitinophaga tropicalis]|uniref:RagB/SusD family nutrient uptake outer membrane protein n=1 Tax=Chitinophaga tropicalis TaxID=2683588 RepID=A0A7K1U3U8_9BACT|nr:RagB/SusD family nutrient uptake outer membrane protein [Chitinophaga tropicalis]MVT09019.1 RagB/SusD family nutrient uptake outer membrane protein [Chitinophaga tropicalis]
MKRYTIILCIFLLSSCSKWLDKEPVSMITDVNFWKNQTEADAGVAGAYALVRKALNDADGLTHFAYGDLPSDELLGSNIQDADLKAAATVDWALPVTAAATWRYMMKLRRYDNFYRIIDQANRCLKFIPTVPLSEYTSSSPETTRDAFLGEAYFLRAFAYFYMARIWGDVPLVLETQDNLIDAINIPRTPQKDILAQCQADIDMALKLLPWQTSNPQDRAIRVSRGAAFALMAHMYAWAGEYAKVIPAADSVIEKGGYSLVDRHNWLSIWEGKSSEGVFEIAQSRETEGIGDGIAFRTLKKPYLSTVSGNAVFTLNPTTLNTLYADTNDLRVKNGFAFMSTTDPICIKYSDITYALPEQTGPIAHYNIVVFRLADIMLLKAEALAATNAYGDARAILDQVRGAAGIDSWTGADTDLFEAIIDERGRELFMEGHRFFDLIRLARVKGILRFDNINGADFQRGKYYWPVDPVLMNLNSRLQQTSFWSDKL